MNQGFWTRRQILAGAGAGLAIIGLPEPAQAAAAYSQKVLALKPVAYWRLGEARGPVAVDTAKQGRNGTYQGTPTFRQTGAIRTDKDASLKLDGNRSYVEIPDHPNLSPVTSGKGMAVEVWMRPDVLEFGGETDDPYVHWLGKGETGQHEWAFRFYSRKSKRPNRISAYIFNPAGGLGSGAYFEDPLTAGEWIHVVACYDPGDKTIPRAGVSIYKNGQLRKGPALPGSDGTLYKSYDIIPARGKAPLRLGTRNLTSFFTGGLDEVAIYPRVLTAAEVLDHYQTAIKP